MFKLLWLPNLKETLIVQEKKMEERNEKEEKGEE